MSKSHVKVKFEGKFAEVVTQLLCNLDIGRRHVMQEIMTEHIGDHHPLFNLHFVS